MRLRSYQDRSCNYDISILDDVVDADVRRAHLRATNGKGFGVVDPRE